MTIRRSIIALSLMTMFLSPMPALALFDNCTISTVGVTFGSYNVFSPTPLNSIGSVTYRCTWFIFSGQITVDLSQGSGTYASRQMHRGTEPLLYNLYLNAAATQIWGNGTGGSQRYGPTTTPNGRNVTVNIFGRIPPGQDVTVGNYTDTIVATINF
jgi:spore coat protein U-like protein